ncbi:MAG: photosynthetic complex putative assembly protein PuhB [Pseudomonadota bacterium]
MPTTDDFTLAPGETLLWTGRPERTAFARRVFRVGWLLAIAAVFAALRAGWILTDGGGVATAAIVATVTFAMGVAAVAVIYGLAAWMAASTTYTLTDRRLRFVFGAALPKTMDIPLHVIDSAGLKLLAGGVGDIALKTRAATPFSYPLLWPHARPWAWAAPEPMVRTIADAPGVADILAGALQTAAAKADAARAADPDRPVTVVDEKEEPQIMTPRTVKATAIAGVTLVAVTIIGILLVRVGELTPVGPDRSQPPQVLKEIVFVDLQDDWVALQDAATGETVTRLRPNTDGVLRGARRAFQRARATAPSDAPFQIALWPDDRLTLSDLATDTHIPLDAYGQTTNDALAALNALRPTAE